jgi:hypothetical protein
MEWKKITERFYNKLIFRLYLERIITTKEQTQAKQKTKHKQHDLKWETDFRHSSKKISSQVPWLTPAILLTQETEIRRIMVQSQPGQKVCKTVSRKTLHKNRTGGVAQGEGPKFIPQYHHKKKKKRKEKKDFQLGAGGSHL